MAVAISLKSLPHESCYNPFVLCLKVLCVNLLNMAVENITAGVREHQQVNKADMCYNVLDQLMNILDV